MCDNTIILICSPEDTILDIKYRIRERTGIRPEQQNLMFGTKYLCNDQTVRDMGIHKESTLHLLPRISAGMENNTGKSFIKFTISSRL